MKVGDQQVTQSDLDSIIASLSPQVKQELARQGRKPIGDQYAMMILLSERALNEHLDSSPAISQALRLQRLQVLAQAEYENMADQATVTPEEISNYYKAHTSDYDEIQIRQFAVRRKAAAAEANDPGLSEADAKARIDAIRTAVVAGTDIGQIAKKFAVPNVVLIDTAPRPVRHGQLLPAVEKLAFETRDGGVTDVVETPQADIFAQVVGHQQQELKDVSSEIENSIRQEKLDAALADLKKSANIWMDDEYFKGPSPETPKNGSSKPEPPATGAKHPSPPKP